MTLLFRLLLVVLMLVGVSSCGSAGEATNIFPRDSGPTRLFNHSTNQWEPPESSLPGPYATTAPYAHFPPPPSHVSARARVRLATAEPPGTVIVDSQRRVLYLVEPNGRAVRYPIGVGREGFDFSGRVVVGRKAKWPDWVPPAEMRAREAAQGRVLPARVEGGPHNPLGARALYLHRGGKDTLYRIHGTNEPWTVGSRVSSGCIRMTNDDVGHLYSRVPVGAPVVVIGPNGRGRAGVYSEVAG